MGHNLSLFMWVFFLYIKGGATNPFLFQGVTKFWNPSSSRHSSYSVYFSCVVLPLNVSPQLDVLDLGGRREAQSFLLFFVVFFNFLFHSGANPTLCSATATTYDALVRFKESAGWWISAQANENIKTRQWNDLYNIAVMFRNAQFLFFFFFLRYTFRKAFYVAQKEAQSPSRQRAAG